MFVMCGVLDLLCMCHVCSTLTLTLVGINQIRWSRDKSCVSIVDSVYILFGS